MYIIIMKISLINKVFIIDKGNKDVDHINLSSNAFLRTITFLIQNRKSFRIGTNFVLLLRAKYCKNK